MLYLTNASTHRLRDKVLKNRSNLELLTATIADLDVLVACAELYDQNRATYSFPTILPSEQKTYLHIEGGHHPFVLDQLKDKSVSNSVEMTSGAAGTPASFLLLTGPNTGGKSTYLRMIANNVVLAQIGAPVAAQIMTLTPMAVMTNMNVQDALDKNQSFFYAQADRVEKILETAAKQKHVLIIMDEILNGTSPEEHAGIERGIIKYLVHSNYLSILATHDRKLQAMEQEVPGVVNIHVDDKSQDTFTIKQGPSLNRNAVQVIEEVGFPRAIVEDAREYLKSLGIPQ